MVDWENRSGGRALVPPRRSARRVFSSFGPMPLAIAFSASVMPADLRLATRFAVIGFIRLAGFLFRPSRGGSRPLDLNIGNPGHEQLSGNQLPGDFQWLSPATPETGLRRHQQCIPNHCALTPCACLSPTTDPHGPGSFLLVARCRFSPWSSRLVDGGIQQCFVRAPSLLSTQFRGKEVCCLLPLQFILSCMFIVGH